MHAPRRDSWRLLTACVSVLVGAVSMARAVEVVCHRGANEYAPENTYAAAKLCIEWGVDYVEIDVRTSKDGVLYILHDPTVNRTTNGKGFVRSLTSEEIDKLDAGSWFDAKFADERVPRLEPYLKWIKGQAKVYFDVKDCDLEELIAMVYRVGLENDCFFWFGAPKQAARFRELDKELALKVNAGTPAEVEKAVAELQADIIEVGVKNMTPEFLATCKRLGVKVMAYEPKKDLDAFRKIVELEADMVNLNHGDAFLKIEREAAAAAP